MRIKSQDLPRLCQHKLKSSRLPELLLQILQAIISDVWLGFCEEVPVEK